MGVFQSIGSVRASSNLLAMDVAAAQIMGYPPGEIPVNKEALSRGIWLSNLEEIEYPCLSPSELLIPDLIKVPFKLASSRLFDFIIPRPLKSWIDSFSPGPEINHNICTRCCTCTRVCYSKAMSITGAIIVIDYRRCIRCFCCHEICPAKAIDVKKKPKNPN
jgi:ferredoxin